VKPGGCLVDEMYPPTIDGMQSSTDVIDQKEFKQPISTCVSVNFFKDTQTSRIIPGHKNAAIIVLNQKQKFKNTINQSTLLTNCKLQWIKYTHS
jgi:hypothetical protein